LAKAAGCVIKVKFYQAVAEFHGRLPSFGLFHAFSFHCAC